MFVKSGGKGKGVLSEAGWDIFLAQVHEVEMWLGTFTLVFQRSPSLDSFLPFVVCTEFGGTHKLVA